MRDRVPGAVQEVQEGPLDLQRAVPGLRAQALPPARPPACGHPTIFYDGRSADELARRRLSESRAGLGVSAQQLADMDSLVTPLVRKGQSPGAIWATHAAELPVGPRTYYRYVDAGVMTCANIDLPRKVRFRPRKKGPRPARPVYGLDGRLYSDFEALPDRDKFLSWQMDCVEGARGEAPALLTLTFPRLCLQLVMLLDSQDQEHVGAALDGLEAALGGPSGFAGVFGTILTDRGHEFLDPERIEVSPTGERRCRVFYCDPLQSTQKSFCERNHAELRRILPKGTPIGGMTRADVALLASHLNSYKRPETGWAAPLALGLEVFPAAVFDALGMELVEPDDVTMTPSLLAHVPGMPSQPRASYNRNSEPGGLRDNTIRRGPARRAHRCVQSVNVQAAGLFPHARKLPPGPSAAGSPGRQAALSG